VELDLNIAVEMLSLLLSFSHCSLRRSHVGAVGLRSTMVDGHCDNARDFYMQG